MATLIENPGFWFGLKDDKSQLPPNWHFEENPQDWLMAIAPDGRRFYWDGGSIVHEQEKNDEGKTVAGPRRNIQDIQ